MGLALTPSNRFAQSPASNDILDIDGSVRYMLSDRTLDERLAWSVGYNPDLDLDSALAVVNRLHTSVLALLGADDDTLQPSPGHAINVAVPSATFWSDDLHSGSSTRANPPTLRTLTGLTRVARSIAVRIQCYQILISLTVPLGSAGKAGPRPQ